jgi:hypothetical protein
MCWARNRYGKDACGSARIRADELEGAVFSALVTLFADPDLLLAATAAERHGLAAAARQRHSELAKIAAEIRRSAT